MKIRILAMLLGVCSVAWAQTQSPYSYTPFPSWTATATSQTSPAMVLSSKSQVFNYASGTVNVVGSSLSTATFAVKGSQDQGVTYNALVIQTCGTAGGTSTTVTVTANGCYWVNLAGVDHVEFVTSGTFTGTNVVLTLRANPNVNTVGAASSSGSPYNPAAVAITGGTINGTTIGGTTPAAANVTTLGASGNITGSASTVITAGGCQSGPEFLFSGSAGTGFQGCGNTITSYLSGTFTEYLSPTVKQIRGVHYCWTSSSGSGTCVVGFGYLGTGAAGVSNGTPGDFSGTLQAGVTATDPGCTTTAHIGKQWFDITTTTTVYKVCLNVAGTLTWVTK
jgi:hypothetical protein